MSKASNEEQVDPILMSVIQKRLKSITEQMGFSLLRSTRSPILSESRDFVTGLYDAQGRILEQTEYIPILAFAVAPSLIRIIEYYKGDIHPGDIIMHNDPFTGGNQPADVKVVKPVFYEGRLVAWAIINGHQADVGGAVASGYNPNAREIWQEAIRITAVKIYDKGVLRKDVWDLIFANIRYEMVEHDILAAIGGCVVGEREFLKMLDKYGQEVFNAHVEALFNATEKMMRAEIASIPDGVYGASVHVYDDGVRKQSRMKIEVSIRVDGTDIEFDYTGTDPQTPGFVNAPLSSTLSATMLSFLMCVNPDIPRNDGMMRPIRVKAPEGCLLNPRFPAATTFGNHLSDQVSTAIFLALSEVIPERVTAAWNPKFSGTIVGLDPRRNRPYVDILFLSSKGGSGATHGVDGYDYIGTICAAGGLRAQDPELFEIDTPNKIHQLEFLTDSAGAGQWRGGWGVEAVLEFGSEGSVLSLNGDGMHEDSAAVGIFGGCPGTPNTAELVYPNGKKVVIGPYSTKQVISDIPKGSMWYQKAGGGGGYGPAWTRDPEAVAEEVKLGLISLEQALGAYKVIVDPTAFRVNEEETRKLRNK